MCFAFFISARLSSVPQYAYYGTRQLLSAYHLCSVPIARISIHVFKRYHSLLLRKQWETFLYYFLTWFSPLFGTTTPFIMPGLTNQDTASQTYLSDYSGGTLLAVCGVVIALETIAVALRFVARRFTTSRFGWDDGFIPFAWLMNIGVCIAGIGRLYQIFQGICSSLISASSSCCSIWRRWQTLTSNRARRSHRNYQVGKERICIRVILLLCSRSPQAINPRTISSRVHKWRLSNDMLYSNNDCRCFLDCL